MSTGNIYRSVLSYTIIYYLCQNILLIKENNIIMSIESIHRSVLGSIICLYLCKNILLIKLLKRIMLNHLIIYNNNNVVVLRPGCS
jgi:hypothetical protein